MEDLKIYLLAVISIFRFEEVAAPVKVTIDTSYRITVKGGSLPSEFRVTHFDFHWGSVNTQGSEHTLNGVRYPMENNEQKIDIRGGSLSGTFRIREFHFHWGSVNTQGSKHALN
ncbi:hypothetical protein KUTeg_023474 [Tegillarca granosa]|uniref:carbonic anhydrase n=1 Tax=Tegillarca granosa TaxID=220873 RepID=A0ABQ9E566_TEGGR|nr:hypothetical protein KUTeg_023474 [Tegillarca granosa]